jgi:hypothetical protein
MKSLPNVDAFKCLAKQKKQSMKKYVQIVRVRNIGDHIITKRNQILK